MKEVKIDVFVQVKIVILINSVLLYAVTRCWLSQWKPTWEIAFHPQPLLSLTVFQSSVKLLQLYGRPHCKLWDCLQRSSLKISFFSASLTRDRSKDPVDGQPVRQFVWQTWKSLSIWEGRDHVCQFCWSLCHVTNLYYVFSSLLPCKLWPRITEPFSQQLPVCGA